MVWSSSLDWGDTGFGGLGFLAVLGDLTSFMVSLGWSEAVDELAFRPSRYACQSSRDWSTSSGATVSEDDSEDVLGRPLVSRLTLAGDGRTGGRRARTEEFPAPIEAIRMPLPRAGRDWRALRVASLISWVDGTVLGDGVGWRALATAADTILGLGLGGGAVDDLAGSMVVALVIAK